PNRKARTFIHAIALNVHRTAVQLGESLDQRKSETHAAGATARFGCLTERLEDVRHEDRVESHAVIGDFDNGLIARFVESYRNRAALGSPAELRCIDEQVRNDLREPALVAGDPDGRGGQVDVHEQTSL